jgi:o-succinylbenzoate synthase
MAFREDVEDPRTLAPALGRVRGNEMAKAALEMAVWELAARRAATPLFALLGGQHRPFRAGVALGLADSPEELCEAVARELEAGHSRIEVKIAPRARHRGARRVAPGLPGSLSERRRERELHAA